MTYCISYTVSSQQNWITIKMFWKLKKILLWIHFSIPNAMIITNLIMKYTFKNIKQTEAINFFKWSNAITAIRNGRKYGLHLPQLLLITYSIIDLWIVQKVIFSRFLNSCSNIVFDLHHYNRSIVYYVVGSIAGLVYTL